jgi:hypothetical protein
MTAASLAESAADPSGIAFGNLIDLARFAAFWLVIDSLVIITRDIPIP